MARNRRPQSPALLSPVARIPSYLLDRRELSERELRLAMLDIFQNTANDRLERLQSLHNMIFSRDPLFYGHLASWYAINGDTREHKEIFLAHLLVSESKEHREAAFMILQGFTPLEVARIIDYCKKVMGKFPRSAKNAVIRYIRGREANPRWFDAEVLKGRKYLKHLYASLRIKPSERAQMILFRNEPPPESPVAALKRLLKEEDPEAQSRIISENKLPLQAVLYLLLIPSTIGSRLF